MFAVDTRTSQQRFSQPSGSPPLHADLAATTRFTDVIGADRVVGQMPAHLIRRNGPALTEPSQSLKNIYSSSILKKWK
ncbi:MAG: hypothetical protein V4739_01170 [Pseudomonadota bacterium]